MHREHNGKSIFLCSPSRYRLAFYKSHGFATKEIDGQMKIGETGEREEFNY